jgi:hypothetical protein
LRGLRGYGGDDDVHFQKYQKALRDPRAQLAQLAQQQVP